jgi:hypothetical protein
MGVARPDIANQLRHSKRDSLNRCKSAISSSAELGTSTKLVTTCPACVQGLAKYTDETGLSVVYINEEMIHKAWGQEWQNKFIDTLKTNGIERVLL